MHILTDNAWAGVEWLKSLGMEFNDTPFTVTGGLWPRAHKPVEPEGTGFFKTYQSFIDNKRRYYNGLQYNCKRINH